MRPAFALIFATALAACSSNGAPENAVSGPQKIVNVETNSPDQTIKSWWKIRDLANEEKAKECERNSARLREHIATKYTASVFTGPALVSVQRPAQCEVDMYSRDIVEVKVESETRAVVLATIKATTPIPAGATPAEHELKNRAEGYRYKYVLEKVGSVWKIAQIYTLQTYRTDSDPWDPLFSDSPKPYISSYVFGLQ